MVAVGACTVLALPASAEPTPTGSPSGSSSPAAPPLGLTVTVSRDQVKADETATVTAFVTGGGDFSGVRVLMSTGASHIDLDTTSCGAGTALSASHGCDFDGVKADSAVARQSFSLAARYVKKKTPVTVSVALVQDGKTVKSGSGTVVVAPLASPSPSPTTSSPKPGKPSDPPVKTKPTSKSPSPTKGSGNGTGHGGGGGTNNIPTSGNGNGSGYVPPAPSGSFDATKSPQVALPPITGNAPSPTVASPDTSLATPQSTLRANKAPVAQEMAFQRVASTQVAWLAALLVACSLLLTQLRLGRRPAASGASAAKRSKGGAHRRPRKGAFGK
ncbi:hypothetical protein DZF91_07005 [Actinomadura logoneensis]|uniref:Uncharacterized protein n=1 Tax=Actinomadura logoneensis TaxID=2293572 RepID=A0A372JQR2_9ACTN|nr:hypothetical protein DZF91_07005 [Actinomadura logoneensis]